MVWVMACQANRAHVPPDWGEIVFPHLQPQCLVSHCACQGVINYAELVTPQADDVDNVIDNLARCK